MSTTRREVPASVCAVAVAAAVLLIPAAAMPAATAMKSGVPGGGGFTADVLWERTVSFPGNGLRSGFAADLDGDGRHEILLHSGRRNEPSHVVALDASDGKELWRVAFPARSCLAAADLNGDGACEVVVACGVELSVLDGATGERLAATSLRGTIGDVVCGNLRAPSSDDGAGGGGSGDGNPASAHSGPIIVYTAGEKRDIVLSVLSGGDLRELWFRNAASASGPFASGFTRPSAMDVDGDGRDEVVVAENGNHLLCLSGDGVLMWDVGLGRRERLNPEGVVSSAPVVSDFLGDGIAELAVGCFAGAVVVMDARTGEVLDRFQFGVESHDAHLANERIPRFIRDALRQTGEPINCLTAVELDGSPGNELVVGCSDGHLYALDPGSGDVAWRFPTRENVYDPCLVTDAVPASSGSVGNGGSHGEGPTPGLVAWDAEGVYLLDVETGAALAGLDDLAGAATLIVSEHAGSHGSTLVRVAPAGGRVTALSCGGAP